MGTERLTELITALEAVKDLAENIIDEMYEDPNAEHLIQFLASKVHDQAFALMKELRDNKIYLDGTK